MQRCVWTANKARIDEAGEYGLESDFYGGVLMDLFTHNDLQELAELRDGVSISIYMPTHRVGNESQQDPIRLKNLLSQAGDQLASQGMRSPEIRDFLSPAEALLDRNEFWRYQSDGLALFLGQDIFLTYRLPVKFDDLLVVSNRFHIKPLLPVLSLDNEFFILTLTQKDIQLYQGSKYGIEQMELEDIPKSLKEALRFDETEKQLQYHTGTRTPASSGERPAMFHGHGVGESDSKSNLLRYFQKVDDGVCDFLKDSKAPLVLAGVDYLLPIYHEANSYPGLLDDGIATNPADLSAEDLHDRAWQIVEPVFQGSLHDDLDRYQHLIHTDSPAQASDDLRAIVPASSQGRVETLFVSLGVHIWGRYDAQNLVMEWRTKAKPGDEDLLDFAAMHTILNRGTVYALKPDEMPTENPLAAIFRYG